MVVSGCQDKAASFIQFVLLEPGYLLARGTPSHSPAEGANLIRPSRRVTRKIPCDINEVIQSKST